MFSSTTLLCHVLCLRLSAILGLFLCMVTGSVLTSLIYMWLSSFPNTTTQDAVFSPLYIFASFVED